MPSPWRNSPHPTSLRPSHGRAPLVLAVDDNLINREILTRLLNKHRYPHHTAENGAEAVEAYRAMHHSLRLILMDTSMPILDGLSATQQIRAFEAQYRLPRVRIVAMSANALSGQREKVLGGGADEVLFKPVRERELVTALEEAGGRGVWGGEFWMPRREGVERRLGMVRGHLGGGGGWGGNGSGW